MRFRFTETAIDTESARRELLDRGAGGYVSFEGWVRDHNEGQDVTRLEYEAFQALAVKEGERILAEALQRFPIKHAMCIHRVGSLDLTDLAVWVGVSAAHRGEAFDACRYVIDEVKHRLPIWKKEHYRSGDSGWVNCERCAAAPHHGHAHGQQHPEHGQQHPKHVQQHPEHAQQPPEHAQQPPQHVQQHPEHGQQHPQHAQQPPEHVHSERLVLPGSE